MSPFQYEYAKLDANVCGGGIIAELLMTCPWPLLAIV